MKNKRYPLTIPEELDEQCKNLVEGDSHYRGSRNQFYIEAIQEKLNLHLAEAGMEDDSFSPPNNISPPANQDERGKSPLPETVAEKTVASPAQPGRKPVLEYRDGAIRNASNQAYMVKSGPARMSAENEEEHFNRIKNIVGVMFEAVINDQVSPLSSPLLTDI